MRRSCVHLFTWVEVVAFVFLFGCTKDVDIELRNDGGNPVIYSFVQADSSLSLSLSKTVSILSARSYDLFDQASVSVYLNRTLIRELVYPANRLWESWNDMVFHEGGSLHFVARDNLGNEIVSASTHIPFVTRISRLDTIRTYRTGSDGMSGWYMNVSIDVADSMQTTDFYQLLIFYEFDKMSDSGLVHVVDSVGFAKDDEVFRLDEQGASSIDNIDFQGLFTDVGFDGQINVFLPVSYFDAEASVLNKKLNVRLYHLSSEYFHYMRSVIIAKAYQGVPILDPVKIYSNASKGLGVVGGLSVHSSVMEINP